jgi:hypothetical protein
MEQFATNFLVAGCARLQTPGNAELARISGIFQTIVYERNLARVAFDKHMRACYHDAGLSKNNAKC